MTSAPHSMARPANASPAPEGYALNALLRQGSASATYRARDLADGRVVLVKTFGDGGDLDLARRVGRRLAEIDHPGVLPVLRCMEREGTVSWILDEVDGADFERVLADRAAPTISERTLRALLLSLLDALGHVHAAGLLHRDIKPSNILLRTDGSPVLIDFDAAAVIDDPSSFRGTSLLTPGYAAIEQFLEDGAEGPWTDIYGLAAVAYRAISGQPPPDARSRSAGRAMPSTAACGEGRFSNGFLAQVDDALALDPATRPRSAEAWRAALAASQESASPIQPGPASAHDDGPPTVRIRRRLTPPMPRAKPPGPEQPSAPGDIAEPRPRGRRRGLVLVALAMGAAAVAGWQGWEYYLTHIKSEWIVDAAGGGDTDTIAEALSRAQPEAIIKVLPGTYAESLTMQRPHQLVGAGDAADIVLLGAGSAPCLLVAAEGAVVRGLSLSGGASGGGEPAPCLDVVAGNVTIEANRIASVTGPAARIAGPVAPIVSENVIDGGPAIGLLIADGATPIVSANAITSSDRPALVVEGQAAPTVSGNRIEAAGQAGLLILGSAGTYEENEIIDSGRSGIEVRDGAEPVVIGNRVRSSDQAGVFVFDAAGQFEGNVVADSKLSGIVVGDRAEPLFASNRIEGSGEHGILTVPGASGRFERNTITGNTLHGIARDAASKTVFEDNTVSGNREPQEKVGELVVPDETPIDDGLNAEAPSETAAAPANDAEPSE